ncbi:microtubule-actin cross-linking factor 1-like isoform X2 [Scyliorhinus canicula]|uniref:microtubule-actin cross-linking factor 1-like isoform X2 n=1 Tax=Scyliorhinus canicula TaxID=7830 RepID=UPI0018F2C635|nr:microtubule-actin cross-linking factor 1-like isoform X2 [Scyliorhinus canicula]
MGNCSSNSGCLGHQSKHCQPSLLTKHSTIQEFGSQAGSGNDGAELKLRNQCLEKLPAFEKASRHSAWACRDTLIEPFTKQTDGKSSEICKVDVDIDISNMKPDSLQQFWLSLGRDCRCESGSRWSGQEVTEITEVTETVITEIIEVTEFPVSVRRSQSMKTAMAGIRKETVQKEEVATSGDIIDQTDLQLERDSYKWSSVERKKEEVATSGDLIDQTVLQLKRDSCKWSSVERKKEEVATSGDLIDQTVLQLKRDSCKWSSVERKKEEVATSGDLIDQTVLQLERDSCKWSSVERKILVQDIRDQLEMVTQAVKNGEQLMKELPGAEVQIVKKKLRSLGFRFTQLQCEVEATGNCQGVWEATDRFHTDPQFMQMWLEPMEKEVSSLSCQSTSCQGVIDLRDKDKILAVQIIQHRLRVDGLITTSSKALETCSDAETDASQAMSRVHLQGDQIEAALLSLATEHQNMDCFQEWVSSAAETLTLRDQEPLPDDIVQIEELISQHHVFLGELMRKKQEIERKRKSSSPNMANQHHITHRFHASARKSGSVRAQPHIPRPADSSAALPPQVTHLLGKLYQVWNQALDTQHRLQDRLRVLHQVQEFENFNFNTWRKSYMKWISNEKSRVVDVFRCIDKDQDGRITQEEFRRSVLASKFPTNYLEMEAVAEIFDQNKDGFIDYYEFANALHPSRDFPRQSEDEDRIEDEFSESQQLRTMRMLRSMVMVRVGGGWSPLDEFLVKNDPCRVKGRTNFKIKEKYLAADRFGNCTLKSAGKQKHPHSQDGSPSRNSSNLASCSSAPNSPRSGKSVICRRHRRSRSCSRSQSRSSILSEDSELRIRSSTSTLGKGENQ